MDNKNINLVKVKYLTYILEKFIEMESNLESFFSERDTKLSIILSEVLLEAREIVYYEVSKIKGLISEIDLLNLNHELLEVIAEKTNGLNNYIDNYLKPKIKEYEEE